MKKPDHTAARGEIADPAKAARLGNPIDLIAEEHLRQREICAALDQLAALCAPDTDLAEEVLAHLTSWLPLHVEDEEADLFPLLLRRSPENDDIAGTLERLTRDHQGSKVMDARARVILQRMVREHAIPDPDEAAALSAFAAHERRHLIVENAIVLPLARVRLSAADLIALRRRIMQRRGEATDGGEP